MNVFLAGTDVQLVVPLVDGGGAALSVEDIYYRVTDSLGTEISALTHLISFISLSPDATIAIPGSQNALISGTTRDLRQIELQCKVAGNTVILIGAFIVELADPLIVGLNSFQSLAQAEFNAALIPNLSGWSAASPPQQIAALVDARLHLCQLDYSPLNDNRLWGQNSLNFVPEGSVSTPYASRQGSFVWGGDLTFIKPERFLKLPDLFRLALNRAQIAEADSILGGNPIEERRRAGITLDTIGESKQMFRSVKALDLPCSRRALSYVSEFVSFSKKIMRS